MAASASSFAKTTESEEQATAGCPIQHQKSSRRDISGFPELTWTIDNVPLLVIKSMGPLRRRSNVLLGGTMERSVDGGRGLGLSSVSPPAWLRRWRFLPVRKAG